MAVFVFCLGANDRQEALIRMDIRGQFSMNGAIGGKVPALHQVGSVLGY
jgi:hypothetical protein